MAFAMRVQLDGARLSVGSETAVMVCAGRVPRGRELVQAGTVLAPRLAPTADPSMRRFHKTELGLATRGIESMTYGWRPVMTRDEWSDRHLTDSANHILFQVPARAQDRGLHVVDRESISSLVRWSVLQYTRLDVDDYISKRPEFREDEWIDLLTQSTGFNPAKFDRRVKLLMLLRLVPFVEASYNLIELGPRETGRRTPFGTRQTAAL